MNFTLQDALLYLHISQQALSVLSYSGCRLQLLKERPCIARLGSLYVYTMSIVVASAFTLSLWRISTGGYEAGLALLFLSMITLLPLVSGIQILKAKKPSTSYRRLRLALAAGNLIVGVVSIDRLVLAKQHPSPCFWYSGRRRKHCRYSSVW